MIDDPIGDELHRLSEEFRKLVGKPTTIDTSEKTLPKQLLKYGLTFGEAEAWFEQEPNFVPSDESLHDRRNRRRLDRTHTGHLLEIYLDT